MANLNVYMVGFNEVCLRSDSQQQPTGLLRQPSYGDQGLAVAARV